MYANGFRFYFTPLSGVLFAFPSRYLFTIGQSGVFSLRGWSPYLQTGFLVSRLTLRYPIPMIFRLPDYHRLWSTFPSRLTKSIELLVSGLFRVRSPLLTESRLISFPPGTEMFQFPGFASITYEFSYRYLVHTKWVSPFRHLRITVRLPTPRSFSQATTSFIASDCQGIHHLRLFT